MTRCCAFLVLIWVAELQLTSSNIIDKAYPGDSIADFTGKAQDLSDTEDAPYQQSDKGLLDKLQKFIKEKNLEQECTEEATKKTGHLLKEREEKDKRILRNNYQILQHGEESFASSKEWLSAIKSGICTVCLVKKICSHPPSFLSKDTAKCRKQVLRLTSKIPSIEKKLKCNPHERFRSINGTCNNLKNPTWGAALTAFERIEGPDYADDLSEPRKSQSNKPLPNARDVSRKVHGSNADHSNPDSKTLSHLAMIWGQFLDHDITLALGTGINCELDTKDPECVNIEIPEDDDVFRNREVTFIEVERDAPFKPPHYCSLRPREHINRLTAFVDGSQIYGSEDELAENLKGNGGMLRDMQHPHGCPFKNLLPRQDPDVFCVSKDPNRPCFMSGDERTNENQGLMSMHTLWLRQHNLIAEQLSQITDWDAARIFQETRKIIGAQLQVITYNEFLPLILGKKTIKDFNLKLLEGRSFFKGYDKNANPSIFAAFAVAAFRFGHSLVQEEFRRLTECGFQHEPCSYCPQQKDNFLPIPLKDFGNPFYLYEKCEGGIDSIFRGLVKDPAAKVDGKFSKSIQENLFRGPGDLSDLISINIQRSRERGVPSYVTFRNSGVCNLKANIKSFEDLKKIGFSKEDIKNLKKVYEDVVDIDLFTGGLLEPPSESTKGGVLGPTFQCLIAEQFRLLRVGDRFWFENEPKASSHTTKTAFTACQLEEIRKTSLAKVICNNSEYIAAIPKEALSLVKGFVSCNELPGVNLEVWKSSFVCKPK